MLEGQDRTADQRLAELVTEVGRAVRRLDQDLLRCLVEPWARVEDLLPLAGAFRTRISGHVNRRSRDGQRGFSTAQTVADLTARTCRGAVERLDRRREVVRLGLERDHRLDVLDGEIVGLVAALRSELLDRRALVEGHVILVGRNQLVGVLGRCLLDQVEK